MAVWKRVRRRLRSRVVALCTHLLTKPLRSYEQRVPNNIEQLKKSLRKGDVILVEGDQRISQVIRYLTQSSWSHSALYVGDELLKPEYGRSAQLIEAFGLEASHLLVEAVDGEGVAASPLRKYEKYNLRICRPQRLQRDDVPRVLAEVIGRLGEPYDVRHLVDLARYFFPVSLVPRRLAPAALRFGSKDGREVICSSMIAKAFTRVGYPILPRVVAESAAPPKPWWQRLISRNGQRTIARFREQPAALVTPRDFDLSPYFEIVKFNHLADPNFSYRDIVWEDEGATDRQRRPPLAVAR